MLLLLFLLFITNLKKNVKEKFTQYRMNNFNVIITFYNPGQDYLDKCLKSIENQNYKNYKVSIVNDKSTKEIKELDQVTKKYCDNNGWIYIKNEKNVGPCLSRDIGIKSLKPNDEDIIILIDGDDKLNNNDVFNIINSKYQDDTQVTFGNYIKSYKNVRKNRPIVKCHKINIKKIYQKIEILEI